MINVMHLWLISYHIVKTKYTFTVIDWHRTINIIANKIVLNENANNDQILDTDNNIVFEDTL